MLIHVWQVLVFHVWQHGILMKVLFQSGLSGHILTYLYSGHGFHIKIGDTTYLFPTAERAPPEGYFGHGYEAQVFFLELNDTIYIFC